MLSAFAIFVMLRELQLLRNELYYTPHQQTHCG